MKPELSDLLSSFLLGALANSGALGMETELLLAEARRRVSTTVTQPDLDRELRKLADKRLVLEFTPVIGSARWRITAVGTSVAQELGLA